MTFIRHNLRNRLTDSSCDFEVNMKAGDFQILDFDRASTEVCQKLYDINQNIFIGLSGGVDSEYVFKKFYSLNMPVTPLIVCCDCYSKETDIAFDICKEYDVEPVVISIDEKEVFSYFYENIHKPFNGIGVGSVPSLIATEYAKRNEGIFIKSEHTIGDLNGRVWVEMNEWDFYCTIRHDNSYNFFMHTPEIVYSIVSKMAETDSQTFKCNLFNIEYRDKIYPSYKKHTTLAFQHILSKREYKPNYSFFEEPQTFLEKYF